MEGDSRASLALGFILVLLNAFFVAAEYALVGTRRSRIEALAKRGSRGAQAVLAALDDLPRYVAGVQTAITLLGIGIGALLEPVLSTAVESSLGNINDALSSTIAIILVAAPLVVLGELIPKYATLRVPEKVAITFVVPLRFLLFFIYPLTFLLQSAGALLLRPLGVDMRKMEKEIISKDELALMVKDAQGTELDEAHATVVGKALRLDQLDAADIMVHRVDIRWLPLNARREDLPELLRSVSHSRLPVCADDLDDLRGIVYLQDLVKKWDEPGFALEQIMRPAEFIPESLAADRIVQRMRETKTQILVVRDEYGGTSGLVTLEDVIEEVFGDLEDRLEAERPRIERVSEQRVVARGDVRYDELLDFLGRDDGGDEYTTETLAEIVLEQLQHVPRPGETVEIPVGKLRVEAMSRSRIIRVGLTPNVAVDTARA